MLDEEQAFVRARQDRLQAAIGRNIQLAAKAGGFDKLAPMIRKLRIVDKQQVYLWARGDALASVDSLVEIARVCGVTLDFLVLGEEESLALADFLATEDGREAPQKEIAFLRSLPLRGYRPTLDFYRLAHQAWKHGLTADLDPERAAQMLIDTHENR